MAEYIATPAQDGVEFGGVWAPSIIDTMPTNNTTYAVSPIDIPINLAIDRNIPLDPPTFVSMTVRIISVANNGAGTLNMWQLLEPALLDFADPLQPLPSTYLPTAYQVLVDEPYPAGVTNGQVVDTVLDLSSIFPVYRHNTWNGRITCVWQYIVTAAPATLVNWASALHATPGFVTTEEIAYVAGLSGYDVRAQSRVDRCDRCGSYDLRERFIDDGYSKGLSVCGDCWDPEDPPTRPIPPDLPPIND